MANYKILFIAPDAERRGAQMALLQIIKEIKEKKPEWECDTMFRLPGDMFYEFEQYGKVYSCANKKDIFSKIGRRLHIRRAKMHFLTIALKGEYNLVYSNTIWTYEWALSIKQKLNIPLFLHLHEAESLTRSSNISEEDIQQCNQIIACSKFAKDSFRRIYPSVNLPIEIRHPQSVHLLNILNDTISDTPKAKFVVGFAGLGCWVKSIDVLPLLVKCFISTYPDDDVHFQWIGKIEEEELRKLQFETRKHKIENKVEFIGDVANVVDYYKNFSVFVLLSREDAYPLVTLENAALGNPIICFDNCSGATEWVSNKCGAIVPYMDFDRLSDVIHTYYQSPEFCRKNGLIAREIISNIVAKDCNSSNITELIEQFL